MKYRFVLLAFVVIFSAFIKAQVLTSQPSFLLESVGCTITFDASLGNKGLSGFTGDIYAHTGVITNLSKSNSDWKYVKAEWNVNKPECKLVSLGGNKWKFTISPDIRTFFGLTNPAETIEQIAFVFRSSDGSKTGRDVSDKDLFLKVYKPGLNINLLNPGTEISLVAVANSITIKAGSSQPATLKLFIGNTQIGTTANNATTVEAAYNFNTPGSHYIIAEAANGTAVVRDSAYICVRTATVPSAPRPQGIKNGINLISDNQVTLSLFAKGKSYVYVLGDFNDWKPDNKYQMKKDRDYFWLDIAGLSPDIEYGFQYYVDGKIVCADPYSEKILDPWNDRYINQNQTVYEGLKPYPSGKTDGVVSVFKTRKNVYVWQNSGFTPVKEANLVIYELLVRDFTDEGTILSVLAKLDYLVDLGINAIELMPVQEFDGNDSWGYNPNFMFAADKAYGRSEDYKKFIDECHKRGIAVILDVVFNHTWGLNPFAQLWWDSANSRPDTENPYLFPIAMHPYNVGSDFNHSSQHTRSFFKEVLKYWIDEYKVDGFRFDLSKGLTPETYYTTDVSAWGNYNQGRIDILNDYYQTIIAAKSNSIVILEHFADNSEETVLANTGMLLWGNANHAFSQTAMGYQSNSSFNWLTSSSRSWNKQKLIGYMESHDEERTSFRALTNGLSAIKSDSVLRLKQLAANASMFLTAPGPKMIWQFGELGYDISIDFNGRTGRKPVRWDYLKSEPRKYLLEVYTKILKFRNKYPSLFDGSAQWNWQVAESNWNNGRRTYLSDGSVSVIVVANFKADTQISATPGFDKTGNWYDVISGEILNVSDLNMNIILQPGQFRMFTNVEYNSTENAVKNAEFLVYPNPASDFIFIKNMDISEISVFSPQGLLIFRSKVIDNKISISNLNPGLYIIKAKGNNGLVYTSRILKK